MRDGRIDDSPLVILGHGASGTAASMRPWVDGLAARGIAALAVDLPRGRADRAVPVFEAAMWAAPGPPVAGGHSFGGRVASLAASRRLAEGGSVAGVLLLSYPLHRPGDPDGWAERTAHWPRLSCPVLLLSGESDPFARLGLLRQAVELLPDGQLSTYPRVGHGLAPVLDDAVDRAAEFIASLRSAGTSGRESDRSGAG
jgi:predicted alpha/beta-hydrolase family hydrolase